MNHERDDGDGEKITLGGLWQIPKDLFKADSWWEKEGGLTHSTDHLRKYSLYQPITLKCEGVPVAKVIEEVVGDAIPTKVLCLVNPGIASVSIDPEIAGRIPVWVSRPTCTQQEEWLLCQEIREFCESHGANGDVSRATGLFVYFEKNRWVKVGS